MSEYPIHPYYKTITDNSVELVKGSDTLLHFIHVTNPDASEAFVQFFNAAAADDVTLGTTAPDFVVRVAATGAEVVPVPSPLSFPLGLCYAVATTPTGNTDTASDAYVTLGYS